MAENGGGEAEISLSLPLPLASAIWDSNHPCFRPLLSIIDGGDDQPYDPDITVPTRIA
jgi:hypothetical protein